MFQPLGWGCLKLYFWIHMVSEPRLWISVFIQGLFAESTGISALFWSEIYLYTLHCAAFSSQPLVAVTIVDWIRSVFLEELEELLHVFFVLKAILILLLRSCSSSLVYTKFDIHISLINKNFWTVSVQGHWKFLSVVFGPVCLHSLGSIALTSEHIPKDKWLNLLIGYGC